MGCFKAFKRGRRELGYLKIVKSLSKNIKTTSNTMKKNQEYLYKLTEVESQNKGVSMVKKSDS